MTDILRVQEASLLHTVQHEPTIVAVAGETLQMTTVTREIVQTFSESVEIIEVVSPPTPIIVSTEALAYIGEGAPVGASGVSVYDEGRLVADGVTELNFIGQQVSAKDAGTGRVNIFVPQPVYASHFNTEDGTSSAKVPDFPTVGRYIAAPLSEGNPYSIGDWVGGQVHPAVNSPVLTYQTPASCSFLDTTTTFSVSVLGADGNAEIASCTTPPITGACTVASPSGITVTVSGWAEDVDQFQAQVSVVVNLALILPMGGRFGVSIQHHNSTAGVFSKVQNHLFYDTNPKPVMGSGLTVESASVSSFKYLSGVRYYSLLDTFFVRVGVLDNLNSNSYPQPFVDINCNDFGIRKQPVNGSDLSGWDTGCNNTGASYEGLHEVTTRNFRFIGAAWAEAQILDWGVSKTLFSDQQHILIDTYDQSSTPLFDGFDDEYFRQTSDFSGGSPDGNWLSDLPLSPGDGMVFGGKLMHPSKAHTIDHAPATSITSFQPYLPKPDTGGDNPTYSGFPPEFNYYRTFMHPNPVHDTANYQIYLQGRFVHGTALADLEAGLIEIYVRRVDTSMPGFSGPDSPPMTVHGAGYNLALFDDGVTEGCVRLGSSSGNMLACTAGGIAITKGVYLHLRACSPEIQFDSIRVEFN